MIDGRKVGSDLLLDGLPVTLIMALGVGHGQIDNALCDRQGIWELHRCCETTGDNGAEIVTVCPSRRELKDAPQPCEVVRRDNAQDEPGIQHEVLQVSVDNAHLLSLIILVDASSIHPHIEALHYVSRLLQRAPTLRAQLHGDVHGSQVCICGFQHSSNPWVSSMWRHDDLRNENIHLCSRTRHVEELLIWSAARHPEQVALFRRHSTCF
mmetsp:Transcript_67538/g.126176  ORF Transcript_67538/g.126176 Transcript_67538/m.126176 type:complete len:210 (+) Transcript_67538:421-1050(+)